SSRNQSGLVGDEAGSTRSAFRSQSETARARCRKPPRPDRADPKRPGRWVLNSGIRIARRLLTPLPSRQAPQPLAAFSWSPPCGLFVAELLLASCHLVRAGRGKAVPTTIGPVIDTGFDWVWAPLL